MIELDLGKRVLGVRLRRDFIVVMLESAVRVFTFSDIPVQMFDFKSAASRAIFALSTSMENYFLAHPSPSAIGHIDIVDLSNKQKPTSRTIKAHNHEIQALAFNVFGMPF